MKKILFLFIVFSFMFNENANSQCSFVNSKKLAKYAKYAKSEDCSINVDIATKVKRVINKFSTAGAISFVKSSEEYYLFSFLHREYSSRFEILENNSLVLVFDNAEPISLYPIGNFKGKMVGLSITSYGIGCFYKIDKKQIQQIADNTIEMVLIHITSDYKMSGSQIDEDGSSFLEYPIKERFSENITESAACIMSK